MSYDLCRSANLQSMVHVCTLAHPSFSTLCLEHMLIVVCRTKVLRERRLMTIPSTRGPTMKSCLVGGREGGRERERERERERVSERIHIWQYSGM